ncbi:unnamed protein product [Lepeophtheirus salmonis]|uniref:(salmon louse) hypothetical protein n=1 Tax=Lepeophtheirus salmonis TaxID=72036 RepID=A0A7R8CD31_LEPSM|nr:unnamed protein product [Lepeophtheirus salmonis]CAF2775537.1 unnamed protein product [Lepeophtheirus salmonis]
MAIPPLIVVCTLLSSLVVGEEDVAVVDSDYSLLPQDNLCSLHIQIYNTSANYVHFGWSFSCDDSGTAYKIHYEHLEWMSCPHGTRSKEEAHGRGYIQTSDEEYKISGLIPFSVYRISIKAIPKNPNLQVVENFIMAETKSLPPKVQFGTSILPTKVSKNSLKFFWRDPSTSQCKDFNGIISHGRYIFKGEDHWNINDEREGTIPITENSIEFTKLRPYSFYSLSLYTLNSNKMLNPIPLIIKARTNSSVPPSPLNVEVLTSSSKDSVPLRWQPGYPPTGEIERYVIKWKYSGAENWMSSLSVPELIAKDHNLTFVISAYNKGVQEKSEWSNEARFVTNHTTSIVPFGNSGSLAIWEILLILLFSLLAMTLILGFVWLKFCHNKDGKYLSVPIYHMSRGGGNKMNEESNLSSPLTRELSKSIQNVPLPPVPGEHLYEELPTKSTLPANKLEYDEEMYLKPKYNISNAKSSDSLDTSEYLQPTFNQVTVDTSNLHQGDSNLVSENPPLHSSPIPVRSYEQKTLNT